MKLNFSRLAIICVALLLLVSAASAWQINDQSGHGFVGNVTFYEGGHGVAVISGYPEIDFNWVVNGDNNVDVSYLFYKVTLKYNATGDNLYSPGIENITLIR
jgi:hypothetical protein